MQWSVALSVFKVDGGSVGDQGHDAFQAAVVASQMQGSVAIKVLCVYVTSGFDQCYRNFLILGPM